MSKDYHSLGSFARVFMSSRERIMGKETTKAPRMCDAYNLVEDGQHLSNKIRMHVTFTGLTTILFRIYDQESVHVQ